MAGQRSPAKGRASASDQGGSSMNSTRLTRFAVSVGMACLILTGNALAGTTTATEVTYAREVATAGLVYTLPVNVNTRLMNIVRGDLAP